MASIGQEYEPTSKASVVGKLAEILRTPFGANLLDALTTFKKKIMIHGAQSRETISDSLNIGCVLITADHNVLSEGSESRNNHRFAVVVQDLATQRL